MEPLDDAQYPVASPEAWYAYEEGKAALRHMGLTREAYEAATKELAERLGI